MSVTRYPSSSPLSSPPSIISSRTVGNSEEDEREMYKTYNWTCSRCHFTQEIVHRCTVAEHYMECEGQTTPVLQCGKCMAQTQAYVPSNDPIDPIDPALLAMSDGSVNSPQLTSSGSATSSPLAERGGRFLRQRLVTPCRRQPVRHHPYQHPISTPVGSRRSRRRTVPRQGQYLPQPAASAAAPPPPPPKPSFTTEVSSDSSASFPPQPALHPHPASSNVPAHANGNAQGHPRTHPPQLNIVGRMHVNRTRIFKLAARDLSEAKAKLGVQAPHRTCSAWEVAWDQLKRDMGIVF